MLNLHKRQQEITSKNIVSSDVLAKQFDDDLFKGHEVYTIDNIDAYVGDLEKSLDNGDINNDEFEKGMKNLSSLQKKTVTDKNGHQRTVYVRAKQDSSKNNDFNPNGIMQKKDVSAEDLAKIKGHEDKLSHINRKRYDKMLGNNSIDLSHFEDMAKKAKSVDELYNNIKNIKDVSSEVSKEFREKYGKDGASTKEAVKAMFNKFNDEQSSVIDDITKEDKEDEKSKSDKVDDDDKDGESFLLDDSVSFAVDEYTHKNHVNYILKHFGTTEGVRVVDLIRDTDFHKRVLDEAKSKGYKIKQRNARLDNSSIVYVQTNPSSKEDKYQSQNKKANQQR